MTNSLKAKNVRIPLIINSVSLMVRLQSINTCSAHCQNFEFKNLHALRDTVFFFYIAKEAGAGVMTDAAC